MFYGLLGLSFWGYVGAALALTHVTIAGVTIFQHRHQAHRALDLHPLVSHFFRFGLWLTTGMQTRKWVAIHRKHYAKCETVEDPHSPQVLGLAQVKKRAPRLATDAIRPAVDMETVRAVLGNRFQVMARFARQVLLPVWRSERERAGAASRRLFRQARGLLVRNDALLAASDRRTLTVAFENSSALRAVYGYKQRLQQVWERSDTNAESPLEALQQWCREAETAGIEALRNFALRLRGFSHRPA